TRRRGGRRAAGVRRVRPAHPVVAVALVAGVVVRATGQLPGRVLVVGLADAPGARLADRLAVAVAVLRRRTVAGRVVRAVHVRAVTAVVGIGRRLRRRRVTAGLAAALPVAG